MKNQKIEIDTTNVKALETYIQDLQDVISGALSNIRTISELETLKRGN